MQRLHPNDLAGHLLTQELWEMVVMPAIAIGRETWEMSNGEVKAREPGDLLQEFHVAIGETRARGSCAAGECQGRTTGRTCSTKTAPCHD
jgi:hypothetical protein